MRYPLLFTLTVLAGVVTYYVGLTGVFLAIASALVCGLLALALALCLVAAGAERDAARLQDHVHHADREVSS